MSQHESDHWSTRAVSFGAVAELYDRTRPRYPDAALSWALRPLGPGAWVVADIGAGTGIMTRLIAAAGHHGIAVEPDDQMRARLAATTPAAVALAGRAEAIPLPDASLDAAVAAQAYHWFDRADAHAELARVVRPGGIFAAIWNDRDESVDWLREFSRIIEGVRGQSTADAGRSVPSFGTGFGPVQLEQFRHSVQATPGQLVELLQSRSYYLTAGAALQASLVDDVVELARTHPDLAGRDEFELSYITSVYRAVRR
jgi:SAM-dependent methyltransferase